MKSCPNIDARDSKVRNRSRAYVRLLTFTRAAQATNLLPKYEVRARLWRAQAERLAELLGRDFLADLVDATLTFACNLPWQRGPRSRPQRLAERIQDMM